MGKVSVNLTEEYVISLVEQGGHPAPGVFVSQGLTPPVALVAAGLERIGSHTLLVLTFEGKNTEDSDESFAPIHTTEEPTDAK